MRLHSFALGLLTLALVASTPAFALVSTEIEPIIGYQRSQRLVPTAHTHDHLVYGGRLIVGVPLLSAEGEYLHGQDSESFPTMSTSDRTDEVKLGLRSVLSFARILSFHLRAGAQATRTFHSETQAGVLTTSAYQPTEYHPYGGAGLTVRLTSHFSFNSDVTAIFRKFPDMAQNEYQATAGFMVSFP